MPGRKIIGALGGGGFGTPFRFGTAQTSGISSQSTASAGLQKVITNHLVTAHGNKMKILFPNYLLLSDTETAVSDPATSFKGSIASSAANSNPTALTFSGSQTIVPPSLSIFETDEFDASIFGLSDWFGTTVCFYQEWTTTSGQLFPLSSANPMSSGDDFWEGGTSRYLVPGGLAGGGGTQRTSYAKYPIGILVRHSGKAIIGYGNSIMDGQGASQPGQDGRSNNGSWFLQALFNQSIPGTKIGLPGEFAAQFVIPSNSNLRRSLVQYATHACIGWGLNDLQASSVTATILANLSSIQSQMLAINPALQMLQQHIAIRCGASSDNWTTTAGQTVNTNFTTTSPAYLAMVAGINAMVGVNNVIGTYDLRLDEQDSIDLDKWKVTGAANYATQDGVHPQTVIHTAIAARQGPVFAALS